ncbi:hypothetical protein [Pedobacter nanyangensis]|uniref:hypothetical protein n=1 Tax=Pedobacter nanyangensis TaxID=1562389 RepID=UPI000DE28BE3|nr:hypothetical protein [Pedobacter nanyangensis]
MKKGKEVPIEIPLEFRVACTLLNLEISGVLQSFIDHVSVYCFLGGGPLDGYSEATSFITDLNLEQLPTENGNGKSAEMGAINTAFSLPALKVLRQLVALGTSNVGSEQQRHQRSIALVEKLYGYRKDYQSSPDRLFLEDGACLVFGKDFRIICELYAVDGLSYLQYFMSCISLAEFRAQVALKRQFESMPQLFVFDYISRNRDEQSKIIPLTEAIDLYITELQKLNARHFIVRDLKKRTECYREFFLSHYYNILKEKGDHYGNTN